MNRASTKDHDQDSIRAAAAGFRVALELGGLRLKRLETFPHGSCSDMCELLGQFLFESGYGEWQFCLGMRGRTLFSHAWLERDGLILDITADQFSDVHEPVVLTRNRAGHSRFSLVEWHRVASLSYLLLLQHSPADAHWAYRELCHGVGHPLGAPR